MWRSRRRLGALRRFDVRRTKERNTWKTKKCVKLQICVRCVCRAFWTWNDRRRRDYASFIIYETSTSAQTYIWTNVTGSAKLTSFDKKVTRCQSLPRRGVRVASCPTRSVWLALVPVDTPWNTSFLCGFTQCITSDCCQCGNFRIETRLPETFEVNLRPSGLRRFGRFRHSAPKQATWRNGCAYHGFRNMDRSVWIVCGLQCRELPTSRVLCLCQKLKHRIFCIHYRAALGKNANFKTPSSFEGSGLFLYLYSWPCRGLLLEHLEVVKTAEVFLSCVLCVCDNLGPLRVPAISEACDQRVRIWRHDFRSADHRGFVSVYFRYLRVDVREILESLIYSTCYSFAATVY